MQFKKIHAIACEIGSALNNFGILCALFLPWSEAEESAA